MSESEVRQLIENYKIIPSWTDGENPKITFNLSTDENNNSINLLTQQEVEAMI